MHTLTIVIPARNEEQAIGGTIQRCLDARGKIIDSGVISSVEIIVASDGSKDNTVDIAKGFDEITVLEFKHWRGYGAMLKSGFEYGSGDLVSFLDGDGTCNPEMFAEFCRTIEEQQADIILGSRLGPDSKMTWVRSFGNVVFAWMLGLLSKQRVRDTASGMRVIRRSVLKDLYPLPDGLHFTPAMSARTLLEGKLKLVEIPMPYSDRIGQSKLSVLQDGFRFLSSIMQAAMCYRPARPLMMISGATAVIAIILILFPATHYIQYQRLEEWMIYRILFCSLLLTASGIIACVAIASDRIVATAHGRPFPSQGITGLVTRLFQPKVRLSLLLTFMFVSVLLVWPGIIEYLTTGHVEMHWSRAVFASLLLLLALMLGLTTFLISMMDLIELNRSGETKSVKPDYIYNNQVQ